MSKDSASETGNATAGLPSPRVVFDATHGQPNWAQTGYPSRELHTNFAGVREALGRLGCTCTVSGSASAVYAGRRQLVDLGE